MMLLIYGKVCYSLLYITKIAYKTDMQKVNAGAICYQIFADDERKNADRDHKILTKQHKTNHRLK